MSKFKSSPIAKITVAVLATVMVLCTIVATTRYATDQSDQTAIYRQETLVQLVVSKLQKRIAHDQESATVWDDAVTNVASNNQAWIDSNLGRWMHTYFGHDGAFIVSSSKHLIYGFLVDQPEQNTAYSTVAAQAVPLITKLSRRLSEQDTQQIPASNLSIGEADIVYINGRPAILSAKPIISDSGKIAQKPGQENIHLAVRYLDGDFAQTMGSEYLFEDMQFARDKSADGERLYYPLRAQDGKSVGYFTWIPFRPGSTVLEATEPVLIGGGLAVIAAIAGLSVLLQGRSKRLKESQKELLRLAHHDALSGLPNRASFNSVVEQTLSKFPAAVLFLDLDRFKLVNDTLGHPVGDRLIVDVAARLRATAGERIVVARIGGDEFTMIIPNASREGVEELAEKLMAAIRMPFEIDGQPILIGLTVGIAFSKGGVEDAKDVLRRADIALYHAKHAGRNCYAIFGEHMDEIIKTRRDLEQDLRLALQDGKQFEVVYQPIYSARNNRLIGVEALCRWNHPGRGTLQPDVFIGIAEEAGLIDKIGGYVLAKAVEAGQRWPELNISVNASAIELRNETYSLRVVAALEKAGFDPKRLEIEITEGALLEKEDACRRNIDALRKIGIRFALDDFGTGFSSFGRLRRLDVDRIKIDRCFIEGYGTSGNHDAIVQAMVRLAQAKGLETTAEGIETPEQKAWVSALGCDHLQGYLMSKPVSANEIDVISRRASQPVVS